MAKRPQRRKNIGELPSLDKFFGRDKKEVRSLPEIAEEYNLKPFFKKIKNHLSEKEQTIVNQSLICIEYFMKNYYSIFRDIDTMLKKANPAFDEKITKQLIEKVGPTYFVIPISKNLLSVITKLRKEGKVTILESQSTTIFLKKLQLLINSTIPHIIKQIQVKYPELSIEILDILLVKGIKAKISEPEEPNSNPFKR